VIYRGSSFMSTWSNYYKTFYRLTYLKGGHIGRYFSNRAFFVKEKWPKEMLTVLFASIF
jgi:hypothetical protein